MDSSKPVKPPACPLCLGEMEWAKTKNRRLGQTTPRLLVYCEKCDVKVPVTFTLRLRLNQDPLNAVPL